MVFEKISKIRRHPLFISNVVLIFTSLIFLSSCIYFDYQKYLRSYANAQLLETEQTLKQANITIENIKKILRLTKNRLVKSQGDVGRIQNLLKEVDYFPLNHSIPSIQKISYYQLTFPFQVITRFGSLPLEADFYNPKNKVTEKESVVFHEDTIIGEVMILDDKHELLEMLEVKMDFTNFKELMGQRKTLSFERIPLETSQVIQKEPFILYAKSPLSLTKFFLLNISVYKIFFIYCCFCLFIIVGACFFIRKYSNKSLKDSVKNLKTDLNFLKDQEEKISKELQSHLEKNKHYQISCHSLKSFHTSFRKRSIRSS